jgi:hypothetical protein
MRATKTLVLALSIAGVFAVAQACSGGGASVGDGAGDGGGDGGLTEKDNPADCPKAVTNQGSPCTREGLRCIYGSGCNQAIAVCRGGTFAVDMTNCPQQGDTCTPSGSECQCSGCRDGFVQDGTKSCPQGPPNSGACGMVCCRAVPTDAGADG